MHPGGSTRGRSGLGWRRAVTAAVVLAHLATACSLGSTPATTPAAALQPAWVEGLSLPPAAVHPLKLELARARGFAPRGKARPRRVRPVARDVRDTMSALYTGGFVDPHAWQGGRFPDVWRHFRGPARRQARHDVDQLTLGRAANRLSEVVPRRARVRVNVLLGPNRNPVAALADVRFAGIGRSLDGVDAPIRHRARYLLRRFGGRWQIVSYRVKRRLVPQKVPGVPTRGTLFILALGSDARPGQSVARSRADSIHVIGVNLRKGKASIVGIPRDSYVHIPGVGGGKINSALFHGGPRLMVRTVEGLTGIRMDGYLLTGFQGFRRMVSLIGGVTVRIPYRMSDAASGAHFAPGKKRLGGKGALAFSRNRHDAPGGDIGRSLNQGAVIVAALRELRNDVRRNPLTLFRWAMVGSRHLHTDLSLGEMLELLMAGMAIEPGRVRNRVVSGGAGTAGGQSTVRLGPGAGALFRDLRRNGILGG